MSTASNSTHSEQEKMKAATAKKANNTAYSDTPYFVYIVSCNDTSFYTGIAKDLTQRIKAHNDGTGAKYTRGRGPVHLVYSEMLPTHSEALKREYKIKQLSRTEKMHLINAKLSSHSHDLTVGNLSEEN